MATFDRRRLLGGIAAFSAQLSARPASSQEIPAIPLKPPRSKFRILSLDGGGARGHLSARILANVETYMDQASGSKIPLGQRFDFIVGTSTGGIIALGLATGRSAGEVAKFYERLVPNVFAQTARRSLAVRSYKPKYDNGPLRIALADLFKDTTLEDVQTDVCITGVALQTGKPRFHKSLYRAVYIGRIKERLRDIALATSAAPTYFEAHSLTHSDRIIDGGVCANNPAVIAIVDALNFERASMRGAEPARIMDDIVMMSVGTGEQPSMPYDVNKLAAGGLIEWAQYIADVMFESQSAVADTQARFLLKENYIRINPRLGSALPLDDIDHLSELKNLSDISRFEEAFIKRYLL
jgi:patatin-like phospholipase/acyl hydrolase